jgi:hypothetical protein
MDILHIGSSLGAGAIAILMKDTNGKDTLIRGRWRYQKGNI